ncbi:MetQ/NlpA family ABC transporter substrate-binding protein [Aeromonas sp. BIGb0445]|uniref:MetQ/NlpA family ABC transporter substrate-binding protein n=1 Tax=Aeromonas sp. BIGb0445 TaxID=2940593 RepID=UPI002168DAD1|nr:MetQ/NlpA family ABC transporter substrate-binding protein [Aeromonas sp. BIGb0445]MCS3460056.1 D-methionine transport system substrate-binding protein [Aeromonas sp. BIGb0445]
MQRRSFFTLSAFALLAASSAFSATAADAAAPVKQEIVIGTTVGDFADMVTDSIKPQLEAKGYTVKLVEFTDYVSPNLALADGSLDVNCFQHKPYLESFAKDRGLSLAPITQVPTGPMGLYSGKLSDLKALKEGSTVAIPNDPTNQARALLMLQDLGWLTLKEGINPLKASEFDVVKNPHDIKLVLLEAAQLPRSREDVDFSVINGNFAASSGIPFSEGLFLERSYDFINWVVVKSADADKPFAKDVIAAYNSPEFKAYAAKRFAGYKYPEGWQGQNKG